MRCAYPPLYVALWMPVLVDALRLSTLLPSYFLTQFVLPLMALLITIQCVNCDVCEPVCPNQAISAGRDIYEIHFDRCTECVGHFDEPQCVNVCPVDCIEVDRQNPESAASLRLKYLSLMKTEIAA